MTAVLGPKPAPQQSDVGDFMARIAARDGPCMAINDEAHHTHDEESEWNRCLRYLHAAHPCGLAAELDLSATPRYSKGALFSWTIYDYPLKQAILDAIVKRPVKGIASGIREQPSSIASTKYQAYLTAGVERWREYAQQLARVDKKPVAIVTIFPDPDKMDKDIAVPILSPVLARKKTLAEEIGALDVAGMNCPRLPRKEGDAAAQQFHYEGYDLITLQKLVERDYTVPEPQTSQEVISYYAKRVASELKLPSQFAALAPKIREFLETRAFGETVDLDEPDIIKAISSNVAQYVTLKTFAGALRRLVVEELAPQLVHEGPRLSETPPFPCSRPTLAASKTIFNLVACDNNFEKEFAQFLEKEEAGVAAFAKLPKQFGFSIDYMDSAANLRYYEPDFVVLLNDGTHYLVETKGQENVDVAHKDRAARIWCENATLLTETPWRYLKVPQREFEKLQPSEFADILVLDP